MAIKGLGGGDKFPQIGKIRKGGKKTENQPGPDLEYFRVIFNKGEDAAKSEFISEYGTQPDEIDVLLPLQMEDVWSYWLEAYSRGRQIAKSDGVKFIYMRDRNMNVIVRNGKHVDTGEEIPYLGERGAEQAVNGVLLKPVGRLRVTIPLLMRRAYLELKTHSYEDCDNLDGQVRSIYGMELLMGGVPLVIKRMPVMKTVPGQNGTSFRKEMYMLSIEAKQEWVRWKMLADANQVMESMGLGSGSDKARLMMNEGVIEGEFTNVNADGDGFENTEEAT